MKADLTLIHILECLAFGSLVAVHAFQKAWLTKQKEFRKKIGGSFNDKQPLKDPTRNICCRPHRVSGPRTSHEVQMHLMSDVLQLDLKKHSAQINLVEHVYFHNLVKHPNQHCLLSGYRFVQALAEVFCFEKPCECWSNFQGP